jgi:chromosome segregation ATPase
MNIVHEYKNYKKNTIGGFNMEKTNTELLKVEIEKLKQEQKEKLVQLDTSLETQLKDANAQYSSKKQSIAGELEPLKSQVANATTMVKENQAKLEKAKAELKHSEEKLKELNKELKELENTEKSSAKEFETQKKNIENQSAKNKNDTNKTYSAKISTIEKTIKKLETAKEV